MEIHLPIQHRDMPKDTATLRPIAQGGAARPGEVVTANGTMPTLRS